MISPRTPASAGSKVPSDVTAATTPDHPRVGGDQTLTSADSLPHRERLPFETPEGVITA
jgi:hypothetical protein